MKDLISEIKSLTSIVLRHIFYLFLFLCWYGLWYVAFSAAYNEWNPYSWSKDMYNIYLVVSTSFGVGYFLLLLTEYNK